MLICLKKTTKTSFVTFVLQKNNRKSVYSTLLMLYMSDFNQLFFTAMSLTVADDLLMQVSGQLWVQFEQWCHYEASLRDQRVGNLQFCPVQLYCVIQQDVNINHPAVPPRIVLSAHDPVLNDLNKLQQLHWGFLGVHGNRCIDKVRLIFDAPGF